MKTSKNTSKSTSPDIFSDFDALETLNTEISRNRLTDLFDSFADEFKRIVKDILPINESSIELLAQPYKQSAALEYPTIFTDTAAYRSYMPHYYQSVLLNATTQIILAYDRDDMSDFFDVLHKYIEYLAANGFIQSERAAIVFEDALRTRFNHPAYIPEPYYLMHLISALFNPKNLTMNYFSELSLPAFHQLTLLGFVATRLGLSPYKIVAKLIDEHVKPDKYQAPSEIFKDATWQEFMHTTVLINFMPFQIPTLSKADMLNHDLPNLSTAQRNQIEMYKNVLRIPDDSLLYVEVLHQSLYRKPTH